jgi:hypothetical protein
MYLHLAQMQGYVAVHIQFTMGIHGVVINYYANSVTITFNTNIAAEKSLLRKPI